MSNTDLLLSAEALPAGFRFACVTAGLKPSGKPDFALAIADQPIPAAALYTANRVQAAPLIVDRKHIERSGSRIQVVAINSGNANCSTGEAGLRAAEQVCAAAAETFHCHHYQVFPSSTGIIGVPLPAEKLVAAMPAAAAQAAATPEAFSNFARGILTTDTKSKVATATVNIDDQTIRIAGACKGAGMIGPQLVPHATMLAYIFTDAVIDPAALDNYLRAAVDKTFNCISIDGDMSTNDTVLLLASGASGLEVPADNPGFQIALEAVCLSLARQIVHDGEGITHVIELQIKGAPTKADALTVAKTIATSPLVKTAWAGNDPNWGRLMAAIGYSGVAIDPNRINIWFGRNEICRNGGRSPLFDEARAHAYLQQREFSVRIDLGLGSGACTFFTTDLTNEYIHINADYST
ncbi:MAG: bifunctional glutamate N-acetyltransferase/amino-acid acetyltransferase ArgJ [Acidobacteriaceae bacterium]